MKGEGAAEMWSASEVTTNGMGGDGRAWDWAKG